jgi:hypothetical protein
MVEDNLIWALPCILSNAAWRDQLPMSTTCLRLELQLARHPVRRAYYWHWAAH